MRSIFITLACTLTFHATIMAQGLGFSKFPVSNTGATVYLPAQPEWDMSLSEDGSKVHIAQVSSNDVTYGVIFVEFDEQLSDGGEEWEGLLTSYMQFLRQSFFKVVSEEAFGYGHSHPLNKGLVGIIDMGVNEEEMEYSIKGWVNQQALVVLWVEYKGDIDLSRRDFFQNGIQFP